MDQILNGQETSGVKIEESGIDPKDLVIQQQKKVIMQLNEKIQELKAGLIGLRQQELDENSQLEKKLKTADNSNDKEYDDQLNKECREENEDQNESQHNQYLELLQTPMTKALRNPLILMKILRKMRTKDLLQNSRLVNMEWSKFSTEILRKQNFLQLSLENPENSSEFVMAKKTDFKLTELTSLLTTSKGFPCASFCFKGNLSCEDAQEFLEYYGENIIKELKLEGKMNLSIVRKLLVSQVSNLTSLKLQSFEPFTAVEELFPQDDDEDDNKNASAPQLVSLRSFDLLDPLSANSVIKEIVKSSPNLKECRGPWYIEEVESLLPHQIHTLKGLYLISDERDIDNIEKLAIMDLKLEYLQIDCNILKFHEDWHDWDQQNQLSSRFEKSLAKILSSSQNSLKELYFILCDKLLFEFSWPRFENVQKLTVSLDFDEIDEGSFKLSEDIFPNLVTIILNQTQENAQRYEETVINERSANYAFGFAFPFQGVAPSVKSLQISIPLDNVDDMPQVFPNLEHLSLTQVRNFAYQNCLWEMSKLKSLELELFPTKFNTLRKVDKMFTGLSKPVCEFLKTYGKGLELTTFQMEVLRTNQSILDLKNLRELRLRNNFRDGEADEEYDHDESLSNGISIFAKIYAIDLHPKLRLVVE